MITLLIQGIVQKRIVKMKGNKTGDAIPILARGLACLTAPMFISTVPLDEKGRLFFLAVCRSSQTARYIYRHSGSVLILLDQVVFAQANS